MAQIGLSEAAKLTGRAQSTIHRAMKTGRLSFSLDENGDRRIDRVELERVFEVKANGAIPDATPRNLRRHVTQVDEIAARDETIRDLRARLDASEEERRQTADRLTAVQERLTALLTDQRPNGATHPDAPRSAWRRFLAWRR